MTITRRNNKYQINGKGQWLTGRKMWANVTNTHGTDHYANLITETGENHEVIFTTFGWGRVDGHKIK